ncbi:TPA: hypothetical protein NNR24_004450 [Salmonella enterica]|nr:hypothetical protein [Salmonella enterica]HCH8522529.1 hypothetical protein [Salmonella enterica]HCH8758439.1 hypothetical protein [Salmonella enterica]HCH8762982.1 hypothetical protein [Salmonella enterica]HCH9129620.1 hypothetical protein [Salmonella enterica]
MSDREPIDRNVLHALSDKKRFDLLYTSVPKDMLDANTVRLLDWFGVYFKEYPEHSYVDWSAFDTLVKLKGNMTKEQITAMAALTTLLRKPVSEDIIKNTCDQLEVLRFEGEVGMILKRFQSGEEFDLASELEVATQTHKQRVTTQVEALWCDTDIAELIDLSADDSGYKFDCLPDVICDDLKGATAGKNIALAMPTNAGKTSLFCAIAKSFAVQHKDLVEAGEVEFQPVLYLINEGTAEDIMPRVYSTVLGVDSSKLFEMRKELGGDGLREAYKKVVGRIDAIRLVNIHGATTADVNKLISKHKPFCVITDMTGRIRCVGAQAANDVQQLETVWDTMRQFAAIHKMIHIGSIQVSAEGMDMLFPPLSALQNSKTGVQTTLDLAIFGGAWMQPTEDIEYQRGISTPKNKLKRAGKKSYLKAETFFNPDLNTWK